MNLEEIEKLCEEATKGPWTVNKTRKIIASEIDNGHTIANLYQSDFVIWQAEINAKFIAASRTLMPKLLAVAKAAKPVMIISNKEHEAWKTLRLALEELEKE